MAAPVAAPSPTSPLLPNLVEREALIDRVLAAAARALAVPAAEPPAPGTVLLGSGLETDLSVVERYLAEISRNTATPWAPLTPPMASAPFAPAAQTAPAPVAGAGSIVFSVVINVADNTPFEFIEAAAYKQLDKGLGAVKQFKATAAGKPIVR
jgi:hypothetical protein